MYTCSNVFMVNLNMRNCHKIRRPETFLILQYFAVGDWGLRFSVILCPVGLFPVNQYFYMTGLNSSVGKSVYLFRGHNYDLWLGHICLVILSWNVIMVNSLLRLGQLKYGRESVSRYTYFYNVNLESIMWPCQCWKGCKVNYPTNQLVHFVTPVCLYYRGCQGWATASLRPSLPCTVCYPRMSVL